MLSKDILGIYEAYSKMYQPTNPPEGVVEEEIDGLVEEVIGELFEECIEEGYTIDEAAVAIEEAATEYLMELNPYAPAGSKAAKAYAKSTTATKRGVERKAAVKGAVERVKAKAKGAKAAAGIAGSIAKDEARRAGRAAKQAVVGAVEKKKKEVKSGIKGFLGKAAKKVASKASSVAARLGEEVDNFDLVLEFLQAEGYAETLEEAEWMMANIINEEAVAIILESSCEDDEEGEKEMKKGKKSKKKKEEEEDDEDDEELDEALTGERYKKAVKKPGGTAYSRMVSADPKKRATRGGRGGESDFGAGDRGSGNKAARRAGTYQEAFESWLDEAMSNYDRNRKRAAQRAAARNAARDAGKTGAVPGVGYVTPRREKETYTDSAGKTRHAKGL